MKVAATKVQISTKNYYYYYYKVCAPHNKKKEAKKTVRFVTIVAVMTAFNILILVLVLVLYVYWYCTVLSVTVLYSCTGTLRCVTEQKKNCRVRVC